MRSPTPTYSFHKWRNDHGGAIVEFAIVLPLLLVLTFGILEFGILFYDKAVLTNATREGARAGIIFKEATSGYLSLSDIEDIAEAYCTERLISFSDTAPAPVSEATRTGTTTGDKLTVKITYQFNFLAFSNVIALFGNNFSDILTLESQTVMLLE